VGINKAYAFDIYYICSLIVQEDKKVNDYYHHAEGPTVTFGRVRLLCLCLVCFLVPVAITVASEKEKPYTLWIGSGIGAAGELHEQYSPLTGSGAIFRLEGGWAVRGNHVLWDGHAGWNVATVSSSREQGLEIETNMIHAQTSVFGLFPLNHADTIIGLGLCITASGIFTSGVYQYEEDPCETVCFGTGPAVFLENTMLDRWVFRLHFSLPLVGYAMGPIWANGSGGEMFSEWMTVPDILCLEGTLSSGIRLSRNMELLFLFTCLYWRQNKPFETKLFHNSVGVGAEFDLGGTR